MSAQLYSLFNLHYCTFQAVCTARHAGVIFTIVIIVIILSIIRKGGLVLNHLKEGFLITSVEAQKGSDCTCNLRGTHST